MKRTGKTIAEYSVLLKNPDGGNIGEIMQLLFYCLNRRNLVALCGAGCSKDQLNYGNWTRLAKDALASLTELPLPQKDRLNAYIETPPDYINLRTILGYLENLENRHSGRTSFRDKIRKRFYDQHCDNRAKEIVGEIYRELIKLDIRRFITTNFDFEIEMALVKEHKVETPALLPGKGAKWLDDPCKENFDRFESGKSFSQGRDCMEQLSQFSLARNEVSDYMVFHCHGRFDDIESCVLTEANYRDWYLRDTAPVKAFRQTMDLLFGSNPLLVIGYSLHDPELGQILRTVHAKRATAPRRSPLFLMLYFNEHQGEEEQWALNEEYGAYVIPVRATDGNIERATQDKLREIQKGWKTWREAIRLKPQVRTFMPASAREPQTYFYYHYLFTDLQKIPHTAQEKVLPDAEGRRVVVTEAHDVLEREVSDLLDDKDPKAKCALLIGKAGSGKTWSMQRFGLDWIEGKKKESYPNAAPQRVFFWSTYYSNDLYNGLKRAIKFFRANKGEHVQFHEIMPLFKEEVLNKEKDALLIFDGIERLLKQSKHLARADRLESGEAINPDVKRFFDMILDTTNGAFVVLTSRIIPVQFAEAIEDGRAKLLGGMLQVDPKFSLRHGGEGATERNSSYAINAGDYSPLRISSRGCKWGALGSLSETDRVSLSAFFAGHLYSLQLVERILCFCNKEERGESLRSLMLKVGNTPTDRRRERIVREAIEAADEGKKYEVSDHNLLSRFIERVALFMGPVEKPALATCLQLAIQDRVMRSAGSPPSNSSEQLSADAVEALLNNVIADLEKRALLLKIWFNNIQKPGFTVHSLVQSYVRKHLHRSAFSIHPSMLLPGYTSDFDVVDPGSGKDRAKDLFKSLCDRAKDHVENSDYRGAGASVRAAFGVLRSRFCSNTVSRWGNYHEYLEMVYRLRDTALASTTGCWSQAETIGSESGIYDNDNNPTSPPLYLGELAWLQNEAGLAAYTEGNMLDSMFMRQQSSEINWLLDDRLPGFHKFQSYFNVGSVFIDLGHLMHARRYLEDAMLIASARTEKSLEGRVLGYIGLLTYLQGNFDDAEKDLRLAIRSVKSNARAKSVFLTFLGQLLLSKAEYPQALDATERSRAFAEGAHYPDLIAYAQLGRANVLRSQNEHVEAKREFEEAFEKARKYGLRRLETGVLIGLSHWAYALHDSEAACRYAVEALTIANEGSLGLHQTECLLALGKALLLANQNDLGKAYLETARVLAKSQGYFLRSIEVDAVLRNSGEQTIPAIGDGQVAKPGR